MPIPQIDYRPWPDDLTLNREVTTLIAGTSPNADDHTGFSPVFMIRGSRWMQGNLCVPEHENSCTAMPFYSSAQSSASFDYVKHGRFPRAGSIFSPGL